ncbi:MAG: hypothetical protein F6K40_28840, partial [Okeania sp. SIO3I5]|uniref:Calx-beta domain-containing protein n=1 Tax=Okeania sp. SIO3I5 TaxID=2607805 RepID=UPI0013B72040
FTGLEISNGETITITGTAEETEWARVDYVEFIPVSAPITGPGTLSLSDESYSVNEDGPSAEVTVTRSNGSSGAVSVTLTPSDGTATATDDYDDTAITVNFADGETQKTVNIPIVDDSDIEGDETINLALSNATNGATLGTQDTAVLRVVDNESPLRIEVEDMSLSGYKTESTSVASDGAVVSLLNSGVTRGIAADTFTGETGYYDVKVGFFDENDGESQISIEIGTGEEEWTLDEDLGSDGVSDSNQVERTVFTELEISNGEHIKITGTAEGAEWGRVDYVEFIPVAAPTTEPAPGTINGTAAGEILTGDEQDNQINGFGGDDTLNGAEGDDNLFGGSGNNIYDGEDGNDTVSYANNQSSGVIANLDTGNVSRKFETWSEDFKILPLGDSNTRGYPNESSIGGYRNELWRSLNGAGYNLDFVGTAYSGPSDIDQDHEGRGGLTIDQLTDNTVSKKKGFNDPKVPTYTTIEDTLEIQNPDMVLLMAGTNDIMLGDDADQAIADLEELVDRIVTAAPDTHVLVASILPNTSNATREARTAEFSGRVESEVVQPKADAGDNVSFVDIFNAPLISSDFTSDGFHLESSGYDKLAEVWEDAIVNTVVAEDTLTSVENLIGSDGNDELTGDNAANELTGGAGDDTLTGGGGDDLFIYSEGDGTDVVIDFELGNDLFGLSGGLTFDDLTIQDAGANTEVKVTSTDEVLAVLEGVVADDITSAHFTTV